MNLSQFIVLVLMAYLSVMIPQTVTRTSESPLRNMPFAQACKLSFTAMPL
jgi:hypothetical protein